MIIWVDADACPGVIKEILFRVSERTQLPLRLIANHAMRIPNLKLVKFIQVAPGFDVADNEIVRRLSPGDIVITADIPLAAEVIEKGGQAINPRGELYSNENIRARLNMRDFMDSLRSSGVNTGGPPPLGAKDQQAFANQLDRIVTKYLNGKRDCNRGSE
jgi:uncharacterized protein YaiI (UPF0178 family)